MTRFRELAHRQHAVRTRHKRAVGDPNMTMALPAAPVADFETVLAGSKICRLNGDEGVRDVAKRYKTRGLSVDWQRLFACAHASAWRMPGL